MGTHWNADNSPKTVEAKIAISMVKDTVKLIKTINPKYWLIENRTGKLRKLNLIDNKYLNSVTLCQYGSDNMAKTDLWTNFYNIWTPRVMCKNGDSCHISAPRGSSVGSQRNMSEEEKYAIPEELSHEIIGVLKENMG